MPDAAVLLLTEDTSLVQAVGAVVAGVSGLCLRVLPGVAEARGQLQQADLALVVAHLAEGEDVAPVAGLLKSIIAGQRPLPVVAIGDEHRPEQALTLMRLGAADYLDRPLNLRRLAHLTDLLTVRARYALAREANRPAPEPEAVIDLGSENPFLYAPSSGMGRVMEQVKRVAPQQTTVLLTGETGTGKTHLARLLHDLSPRRDQPFLVINCSALSATLIESEMFGHVKGAFTGADRDRVGKFAEAGRGTLLLDEINSLPLELQAKLLRAVEERVFEPVGSNRSQPVHARLIVATNQDLEQEVAAGRFRSDLYYRFNVVGFHVPPLRDRPPEVIAALARRFLDEFARRNGCDVDSLSADALAALQQYTWPGNIRELRNVIERAVALCPAREVQVEDLPECIRQACGTGPELLPGPGGEFPRVLTAEGKLSDTKERAEAAHIAEVLRRHRNNRQRAAKELGISRMTLYTKMQRYGLMSAG